MLGLGSIGLRHATNLSKRGYTVVGFDPDEGRRKGAANIGVRAVARREDAIVAADIVVIASPSQHHRADLADALTARRHVFVEKPIAHRSDGVSQMLAAAEAAGLVVFSGFNLRFHPAVVAAKERLSSGAIGRPIWANLICGSYLPSWRPNADYRKGYAADPKSGGVVLDIVHEIDLALHLLGPAHVAAASAVCSGLLDMPSDDIADFVLAHENGARSNLHLDYLSRPAVRTTRIAGEDGALELDLLTRRIVHRKADGTVAEESSFPGSFAEDYVAEMDAFVSRVEGAATPGATGDDGLRALEIALAVRNMSGLPHA